MSDDPDLRRLLFFLLGGSRGGENRARIIRRLRDQPSNMNQLAGHLGLQYKAIQHHIRILANNSLLVASGEKYGNIYSLTPWFQAHIEVFNQVCDKLGLKEQGAASPSPSIPGKGLELPRRHDHSQEHQRA